MTDTERGRALLEARRDRIVTHTNVESVGVAEFRAFIDLALAADRRRQARIAGHACNGAECRDHYVTVGIQAEDDEDAALDALLAHLAGEGA
jgi:hypothetical protein